jgi:hypothetical protein
MPYVSQLFYKSVKLIRTKSFSLQSYHYKQVPFLVVRTRHVFGWRMDGTVTRRGR